MPDTIVEIDCRPGSALLLLTAASADATGVPEVGGYALARVGDTWLHRATVPTALAGAKWYAEARPSAAGSNYGFGYIYDLTDTAATFVVGDRPLVSAAELAAAIAAQFAGSIAIGILSPVTEAGALNPLVRGDDYTSDTVGQLVWTFDLPGVNLTDATCWFGASKPHKGSWNVEGEITPDAEIPGRITASFDLLGTHTNSALPDPQYGWSVEVRTAAGKKITRIRGTVPLLESYTH